MYVEDVYTITGRGVVATGRIVNGTISTGDSLAIVAADGTKKEATVAGIEMFRKMLDEAEKGDNIGLLFNAEIDKTMVSRGDSIISADSTYSVTGTLKGTLKLTTKEEGGRATAISEEHSPQFYRSGHDFTGKITGLTDGTINPGETQEDITVTFSSFKGVFYVGQELSVREGGRTIGTFTITSLSSGGRVTRPGTATRPGTVTRPTTGSDTTEEEEESSTTSGGRVSIPTGKNEYME
jgi:elongation factor Tu